MCRYIVTLVLPYAVHNSKKGRAIVPTVISRETLKPSLDYKGASTIQQYMSTVVVVPEVGAIKMVVTLFRCMFPHLFLHRERAGAYVKVAVARVTQHVLQG